MTEPAQAPEPVPTTETRSFTYDEVPNNHLSPMGTVDELGRFAHSVGPQRLTKWFRIGLAACAVMIVVLFAATLFG